MLPVASYSVAIANVAISGVSCNFNTYAASYLASYVQTNAPVILHDWSWLVNRASIAVILWLSLTCNLLAITS